MIKRNKSWEIILAGLAFVGIGIYLLNNATTPDSNHNINARNSNASTPPAPAPPSLPGTIVIDLHNLESLQNLEKLRHLKEFENIEQLEFEIKNLDKLIKQHTQKEIESESLHKGLQQLEEELQKIEQTDFDVTLQDKKLYINKNYNVDKAQWSEVGSGEFVFEDSFSASDMESLDFNIDLGNLNIVGNNSSDANITLRATGDIDNPETISERLNIEKDLSSKGSFSVSVKNNTSISSKINLEATLTIPHNLAVNASTSGGHINANSLDNNQQFNTSGGHITVADLSGTTIAKTSGGHITSDRISGDAKLTTGGGHIRIDEWDGILEAKTGGGHIEIQGARGSISARTAGGNISSSIIEASGELNFSTSAGSISLTLPQNINADLNIKATSIQLDDVFNFNGEKDNNHISGTLNDGGLPIVVNCGYGNVNINAQN